MVGSKFLNRDTARPDTEPVSDHSDDRDHHVSQSASTATHGPTVRLNVGSRCHAVLMTAWIDPDGWPRDRYSGVGGGMYAGVGGGLYTGVGGGALQVSEVARTQE